MLRSYKTLWLLLGALFAEGIVVALPSPSLSASPESFNLRGEGFVTKKRFVAASAYSISNSLVASVSPAVLSSPHKIGFSQALRLSVRQNNWESPAGTSCNRVGFDRLQDPSALLASQHMPTLDWERVLHTSAKEKSKKSKKKESYLAWGFLGCTVVSGALSLYLKDKADDRYDDYLQAGTPGDMNRYLKDARRYDNYSAVAYGGFQVSFVLWLYFFLKSR